MAPRLTIGRVAEAAGCRVQTIRYYEEIGLLARPPRSPGNQRLFARADIERLVFIRRARALGFPLAAIRDLLSLSDRPEQSCAAVDAIARSRLVEVESRIERLQALRHELSRMIEHCRGGRIATCRVIEALGDSCLADSADDGDPADAPALRPDPHD